MTKTIHITKKGLIAGEQFLRDHTGEFDDGTRLGSHAQFVRKLLLAVFRASHIACDMQLKPYRLTPEPDSRTHL